MEKLYFKKEVLRNIFILTHGLQVRADTYQVEKAMRLQLLEKPKKK